MALQPTKQQQPQQRAAHSCHQSLHPPKTIRRKRLQHYIRQIKHLIVERMPPRGSGDEKLGTLEALHKTVELLRATPTYSAEAAAVTLSPPHSLSESGVGSGGEASSAMPEDGPRRHVFSARISLPDGNVVEIAHLNDEWRELTNLRVGSCFFDILSESARQTLLVASVRNVEKKRVLVRLGGENARACELICELPAASGKDRTAGAHIYAFELRSAFGPSQPLTPISFCTSHSAACTLTHIDAACAPYIGHLPDEVTRRSILYLIHPYDIPQMKQIHAELVVQRGGVVRQRRLRWVAHNGSIVHTDSEWCAFWNPWSRRVEFILGRHTVNEQPVGSADVLAAATEQQRLLVSPLNDFAVRTIEAEISTIMSKCAALPSKLEKRRCAPPAHQKNADAFEGPSGGSADALEGPSSGPHLGTYIDNLVETLVINAGNPHTKYSLTSVDSRSAAISPTDLSSTNCSNSIPLSYNQINCLENVHRLLKSQPRTEASSESSSPLKVSPSGESRSPLPVPDQDDGVRTPVEVGPAMPLTRELLQQHTRKWEQEYRDTWKKRLSVKRSIQQNDFVVPVSAKIFRDCHQKPSVTQSAPATFPCSRPDYWTAASKDEYYRSLGPNPPPPPGRNFQITSVPLPPPLPIDEQRRSAFVLVPPTAASASAACSGPSGACGVVPQPPSVSTSRSTPPHHITAKSVRDLPQPINLSISEPLPLKTSSTAVAAAAAAASVASISHQPLQQMQIQPPPLPAAHHHHHHHQQQQQQQQHRSVIQSSLLISHHQQQQQQQQPHHPAAQQVQLLDTEPLIIPAPKLLTRGAGGAGAVDWDSMAAAAAGGFEPRNDNCAARLMSLAQRAQQQQQLEQRRLLSPLTNSPVKEATDALMLLQDTA